MAKYYGTVGFSQTGKTKAGVWQETGVVKRQYSGDVRRYSRRLVSGNKVNDDLSINLNISIVADPYALQNFHNLKFVEYMGAYWKVSNVEVQYPRLLLELGEVYNGPTD
jgi:hypothetical protein